MIRIDEIYNNTFWPFVRDNIPVTRVFFCDPFGHTKPENLFNHGKDEWENNYIFFHDQEPILLDIHQPLFDEVAHRNVDLQHQMGPKHTAFITSEKQSTAVEAACNMYGWKNYYYFFHGWASLDWYRGYNHTFLMPPPEQRKITKSFISPNRIVGGYRSHRLLLMYYLLRGGVNNALISFPKTCPYENHSVLEMAAKHCEQFPDIESVFTQAQLPWNFEKESGSPMHSCWLSLFDEVSQSMAYVVTETIYTGSRLHLTEKVFKPICQQLPFVLVSTANSLAYLREYGFKTFGDFWDESYDSITDDDQRLEKIAQLLLSFDQMSVPQLQELYQATRPVIEHNYNHFYQGNFEKILWQELTGMLGNIRKDFSAW
jgi:hypothetical protein